jgi:hypothetical protein
MNKQMEISGAKRLELVSIDWETNCVDDLTRYMLNCEYRTNNYADILHRVLINLDTRRRHLETFK